MTWYQRGGRQALRIAAVIAVALGIGFVITLVVSEEPLRAFWTLLTAPLPRLSFEGGLHIVNLNRFGNWIEESITLVLLGLSVAIVFSAKQFSLGAEGQLMLGALAGAVVALRLPAPPALHLPLVLLTAAAAGFLWGWIPGLLKAYLSVDEIVSTLMLNVIAAQIYQLALAGWLRDPQANTLATIAFPAAALLPTLVPGTRITLGALLTLGAVAAVWYLMYRTPYGYRLRILGSNPRFAEYAGINTRRTIASSMAVGGILAGLAGVHIAHGLLGRLTLTLSPGIGFEGIVVALLARNHPVGVLVTGLLYGYLRTGGQIMERTTDVTREVVLILQAIIILLVTAERLLPAVRAWRGRRRADVTV